MRFHRISTLLGLAFASLSILVAPRVAHADDLHPLQPPSPPPAPVDAPASSPGYDVPRAAAPGAASVKMTLEATQTNAPAAPTSAPADADRPGASLAKQRSPDDYAFLHGFRLGYGHVMNYDHPSDSFGGKSLKDQAGLRSPHHFLLGYEVLYRVVTHSWLNVLLLGNVMVAGLEQSKFLPSGNFIIGAELKNSFQIGVGANVSPLKGSEAHTVLAAGWTPRVGTVYTPIHFYFIPDVDGNHRIGVTTGVTF